MTCNRQKIREEVLMDLYAADGGEPALGDFRGWVVRHAFRAALDRIAELENQGEKIANATIADHIRLHLLNHGIVS